MKHYYCQELHYGGLVVNGAHVPFEVLEGNQAVIVLDDEKDSDKLLVQGLNSLVGTRTIARITEEEYNLKKNEFPLLASKPQSKQEVLRVFEPPSPAKKAAVAGVKSGIQPTKPAPIDNTIPKSSTPTAPDPISEAFKPATGRPQIAVTK